MEQQHLPLLLVVDDSKAARDRLGSYLRREGYEVVEAADRAEALKQLKLRPAIALVLLDLEMPIITGFEVLRMRRMGGRAPDVPVLALTGAYRDAATVNQLKHAGATGYINKDVELADIRLRIDKILFPEPEE